jgi:hypothetical protein
MIEFERFDADSSEVNLRRLLKKLRTCHKEFEESDNGGEDSETRKKLDLHLNQNYNKFKRELQAIQQEYDLKQENIIGKKYRLEEEILQLDMFMDEKPSSDPPPNTGNRQTTVRAPKRTSSQTKPQTPSTTRSQIRIDSDSVTTSKPPVVTSKSYAPSAKLNPNKVLVEISDSVRSKELQIEEMKQNYNSPTLSDMQKYALKQRIAKEQAELKKLERSIKNLEQ